MTFSRRRRPLLFSAAAAGVLITGCGKDEPQAEIEDAAAVVAEAISSGDFSEIDFTSDSTVTLTGPAENLHEPFDGLTPEVSVADIERDVPPEDSSRTETAEVTYEHSWDLAEIGIDGEQWSYQTSADFNFDEEQNLWRLESDTEILLPDYAGHEPVGLATTSAERGRIMDDAGRAMVYNRDIIRIGLDKTQLPEDEGTLRQAAAQLAEATGLDAETYAERVLSYGDEAFVPALEVRADDPPVTAAQVEDIPGAVTVPDQMPLAERADFAPLLLGRVGEVTAEHLEEDPTLQPGDMIGLSGIQATQEQRLRGTSGLRIHLDGETLWSAEPETGEDVETHLNPRLQDLAQQIVGAQEVTAGIVAIRPSDGGILAAASHTEDTSYSEMSLQSSYAPGSTFKLVSALAMLRDGLEPDSMVSCPNNTTVHGQEFSNVPGYPGEYLGSISFAQAVAASCNTLFAAAYDDVTSAEVYEASLDLGLNNDTGIGLHAIKGLVPDDSELNLHAANLFGQGVVETSVLGMATVAASIGAGETVHPRLVALDEAPEWAGEGDLTAEEAADLLELMEGTVDFGTLQNMDPVPGEHVYAKTGTAEAGEDDDAYAHTWVTALQGDLAVAIFLEEGEFGGSTNGPLLHEFLTGAQGILAESE